MVVIRGADGAHVENPKVSKAGPGLPTEGMDEGIWGPQLEAILLVEQQQTHR